MRRCAVWACVALAVLLCADVHGQITLDQVDNFQSLDASGWTMGPNSIQFPIVIGTGGPLGNNDAYLDVVSTGTGRANSKMIAYNGAQWAGNYVAAGVTGITTQMADFGPNPLFMRIAIQDSFGSEFGSTNAIMLPADSQWHTVSFDLTPAGLTVIQGGSSASQALSNVGVLRILSAQNGPSFMGDTTVATLGIDDVTAVPEPLYLGSLVATLLLRRCRR